LVLDTTIYSQVQVAPVLIGAGWWPNFLEFIASLGQDVIFTQMQSFCIVHYHPWSGASRAAPDRSRMVAQLP